MVKKKILHSIREKMKQHFFFYFTLKLYQCHVVLMLSVDTASTTRTLSTLSCSYCVIIQSDGGSSAWKEQCVYPRPNDHWLPKCLQVRHRECQYFFSSGLHATCQPGSASVGEKIAPTNTLCNPKEPTKMTSLTCLYIFHPFSLRTGEWEWKAWRKRERGRTSKINYPAKTD